MSALAIIAVAGIGLWVLAELVLPALFGYIGAGALWLLSFGRVRLEPLTGGESEVASRIGFILVFGTLLAGYALFQPA